MSRKTKTKIEVADAEEVKRYGSSATAESVTGDTGQPAESGEPSAAEASGAEGAAKSEVDRLKEQIAELSDKHLRAVAELQNFRRRAETERNDAVRYASADLIRALLPAVDDLERTMAAASTDESSPLLDGVKLVHQNLLKALEVHHVKRIESVGQPFDPALHEAMTQQPSADQPPGTVLVEYEPGYVLWDRVLRHAKVIVAKEANGGQAVETGIESPQE